MFVADFLPHDYSMGVLPKSCHFIYNQLFKN